MQVKPKKYLGQHFLNDETIAQQIISAFMEKNNCVNVLEIGAGTGVLTKYLIQNEKINLQVIDIDRQSVEYLKIHFPQLENKIIEADFLRINLSEMYNRVGEEVAIIGNFPYNISSQILFKVLENRQHVPIVVGMFQKEVAERIAAKPKNKSYGILSVLMQAYYDVEYLWTVSEAVFIPPPKVKSGVLRFIRNDRKQLNCDEQFFFKVVKTGFNQRRKTLRNALKIFLSDKNEISEHPYFNQRAEELSVEEFVELTNLLAIK